MVLLPPESSWRPSSSRMMHFANKPLALTYHTASMLWHHHHSVLIEWKRLYLIGIFKRPPLSEKGKQLLNENARPTL